MKPGESVIRVQAYKDVKCRECDGWIIAGQTFLIDMIPHKGKRYAHNIHEGHWKGPVNVIVDKTKSRFPSGFKRWKGRTYEQRKGKNY